MAPPRPWIGKANDYRGITRLDPGPPPSIGVVLPGGEGAARVAVESQSYEGGFGLIEASRDADADAAANFDVVVVAGDGVPGEGWLEAHARWHRRAGNVVVLGPAPDEARDRIIRGSRLFLGNDEAFAALTPRNVSMPREAWARHTELDVVSGWRLWNDGCFFAYEPGAVMSEQGARSDTELDDGDEFVLADAIPHRRFRQLPSAFHSTPKVSWLIAVETPEEARAAWEACQQSTFQDHDVVFHGPDAAVAAFRRIAASNLRLTVVSGDDGLPAALAETRGELVAIRDPRAMITPETVAKAVSRFEANPSAPVVRVGYAIDGGRYLRFDDLAAVDAHLGRHGLPLFALVSRREMAKTRASFERPMEAWSETLARCDQSLVVSPLVRMSAAAPFQPDMPGLSEVASIGVKETAREIVREARRRRARSETRTPREEHDSPTDRLSVAYVGFTGHDNLGDEAVRVAIERLMPWANFETDPADPRLLMVGGGTLINGRRYYLNRMLRQESASVERALFGTGVRSPEYWGVTEPMEDWFSFIDSSLFAGVRGPDSVKNLRTLGYGRDLPVIGDPALFLEPPADSERVEGRVVVCPVHTGGNLHGGDDEVVFDALARLILRLRSESREVVMLSAFPKDDRWMIDIMRRASAPDLPYLAGYADIDDTMRLLASADIVVGERLHAAIMAAAAGTPFVGLEYRPKLRDFGRSVAQEEAIIRTSELERLDEVFDSIMGTREKVKADLDREVSRYRRLQSEAADELRRLVVPES